MLSLARKLCSLEAARLTRATLTVLATKVTQLTVVWVKEGFSPLSSEGDWPVADLEALQYIP